MTNKNMEAEIYVRFDEATSRQSLDSGDSVTTLFGKIKKWLSGLKSVAFSGSYNDLNDKPTSLPANGGNSDTVNNHTVESDVPADAVFTDTTYSTGTASTSGLTKLYTSTGSNTDGSITQKAITDTLDTKADNARKYTLSISASESWTSGTNCKYITKTVEGLKTTDNIEVSPALSTSDHSAAALQLEAYKCILNGNMVISADDTIIIYCYGNTPTTALTLNLITIE